MGLFVGITLQEARKEKRISLKKAALDTKINTLYLAALEAEDFSLFPAEVYLKSFLRNYARYLNLNADELIKIYQRQRSQLTSALESGIMSTNKTPTSTKEITGKLLHPAIHPVIIGIIGLFLLIILWWWLKG